MAPAAAAIIPAGDSAVIIGQWFQHRLELELSVSMGVFRGGAAGAAAPPPIAQEIFSLFKYR